MPEVAPKYWLTKFPDRVRKHYYSDCVDYIFLSDALDFVNETGVVFKSGAKAVIADLWVLNRHSVNKTYEALISKLKASGWKPK